MGSSSVREDSVREKSRPAPPALQAIVDTGSASANRGRPSRPQAPSRTQTRTQPVQDSPIQPTLPPRLTPVRIQSFAPTKEPQTTLAPTTASSRFSANGGGSRFSTANRIGFGSSRFQPTQAPTTTTAAPTTKTPRPAGLPDPVPAEPGPNG